MPTELRLTALKKDRPFQPIAKAEVLLAVHGLSWHKVAGEDGLNTNSYTSTSVLLVPAFSSSYRARLHSFLRQRQTLHAIHLLILRS